MSRTTLPLSVVTVFWLLPLRRFGAWFWPSGASSARSPPRCSSISVVSARSASAFVSSERLPFLPTDRWLAGLPSACPTGVCRFSYVDLLSERLSRQSTKFRIVPKSAEVRFGACFCLQPLQPGTQPPNRNALQGQPNRRSQRVA